jgi:hypothetical protein
VRIDPGSAAWIDLNSVTFSPAHDLDTDLPGPHRLRCILVDSHDDFAAFFHWETFSR